MWKRSEREKQQRVDTRRRVAQKLGPTARVILSQTQAFGEGGYSWKQCWQRESVSLPRCSHFCLYSRDFARWYQHGPYHTKARRGKRLNYGSRLDVGLPPTKLLLRLTEQLLHVQQMVFVEATFPSKALGAV